MAASRPSLTELRAALPDLAAEAKSRSVEFEAQRRLAPDFVDRLKQAGLMKVLVPADVGGYGASLTEGLDVLMTLAEADASTGWVCAHGNICAALIHGSAEPGLCDEFFADPAAYASWSSLPRVQVVEQSDGLQISGSWGFESGCTGATFVGGVVILPPVAEGAEPRIVVALAPVNEARIEDTWDPIGLAGTGTAIWACGLRGESATAALRLDARVAGVTAVQHGAEIVRQAYDACGASALRRSGALQRLLRDASCLTHHVSSNLASYELTGRVRCDIDELSFRI